MVELLYGVLSIKSGLEYHYNNYIQIEKSLTWNLNSFDREKIEKLNNETIAYFNRLGQFYYFAKSEWVKKYLPDYKKLIPLTIKYKVFRMKQSAHRATDYPGNELKEHMEQLDRLFTYQCILIDKKILYQVLLKEPEEGGKKSINFTMSADHPLILNEISMFIEQLKSSWI